MLYIILINDNSADPLVRVSYKQSIKPFNCFILPNNPYLLFDNLIIYMPGFSAQIFDYQKDIFYVQDKTNILKNEAQ